MLTAYAAATDIMPDSEITGELSTEEEVYDLTLDEAQSLQIDLTSEAFDAYLRLETDDGEIIAEDDDGGNDLNAQITVSELAPGDYRVVVTSFFGEGSGVYTLSIQTQNNPTQNASTEGCADPDAVVDFAESGLESAVQRALGVSVVTCAEIQNLTSFVCKDRETFAISRA
ncbi:MAG: pre-peptidase C-terminal domain-containing protein [Trueperaceae bacterium]|nr:pre-peptidase C-terminal domain-containing protein [Trueperaceae bacterium]